MSEGFVMVMAVGNGHYEQVKMTLERFKGDPKGSSDLLYKECLRRCEKRGNKVDWKKREGLIYINLYWEDTYSYSCMDLKVFDEDPVRNYEKGYKIAMEEVEKRKEERKKRAREFEEEVIK